jgi:HPt (histidine-containing phosphotransfer) domain-containing protein
MAQKARPASSSQKGLAPFRNAPKKRPNGRATLTAKRDGKARASTMDTEIGTWTDSVPARGRKTPSRPVDLVHLSRYTLGERALEREVLELFCTQSVVYLERLRTARTDKEWREAAHSLKGSAQAIGAWGAAAAAEQAEQASGEVLAAGRPAQLLALDASVDEARTYIRSLLKDR